MWNFNPSCNSFKKAHISKYVWKYTQIFSAETLSAYYQSCLVTLTKGMLLKFRSFAPSKKQVKTEMRRWNLFNHFSWTRCCLADEKSFLKLDLDMGLAKISLRMHLTDYVTVENSGSNELIIFCFLYEYFLLLV